MDLLYLRVGLATGALTTGSRVQEVGEPVFELGLPRLCERVRLVVARGIDPSPVELEGELRPQQSYQYHVLSKR